MKKGDWVNTPRFCKVKIQKVFRSEWNAFKNGFTIGADYKDAEGFSIYGKSVGHNLIQFAAVRPEGA
jgi:hypothetical protein